MKSFSPKSLTGSNVNWDDTEALIQLLAEIPIDQTEHGYTPLYRLISAKHEEAYEAVEFLLKAGADPNHPQREGQNCVNALFLAAGHHLMRVTRLLLENGADPNLMVDGGTAFHVAAITRQLDMVQLFLEFGANPSTKDDDGLYPLDRFEEGVAYWKQGGGTVKDEAEIRRLLQPIE